MYSKDGGETWKMHNYARSNTTEAQVAEVEPGVLMLNMRDNRKGSRAVAMTKDLGQIGWNMYLHVVRFRNPFAWQASSV